MLKERHLRLYRGGPPSDPKSEHELMLFASVDGRAGQVDHNDVFHLFAWVDEITGGGDGIQFDTDNVGDWLRVHTTGQNPSDGRGIHLIADDAAGGIELTVNGDGNLDLIQNAPDNDLNIYSDVTNVNITAGNGLIVEAGSGGLQLISDHGGDIVMQARGSGDTVNIEGTYNVHVTAGHDVILGATHYFTLDSVNGYLHIDGSTAGIRMQAQTGSLDLISLGAGQLYAAGGSLSLQSSGSSDAAVLIQAAGGATIDHSMIANGGVYGGIADPGHYLTVPSGSKFQLWTGSGGTPILVVDNTTGTPTFHLPTGASWIADL